MATHGAAGMLHYARWLTENHPEMLGAFYQVLDGELNVNAAGGGDTDAPQVKHNAIPKEWYHTDWVADRTIAWLNSLEADNDWFCWMSFPDPHHPWDPPQSEISRVNWRDVDLPAGYEPNRAKREAILDDKARHWRMWYDGALVSNYEAPAKWVPATLTEDQIREVNALNAVEVELIDEAIGRVLSAIDVRGWGDDVDIIFTTDHGEFQGDFGLLFKGPYHVDALMRLPLIWRPAKSSGVNPAGVDTPVSLVSLASTFLAVAGVAQPEWAEEPALPISNEDAHSRNLDATITEWDSALFGVDIHVRSVLTEEWLYTRYAAGYAHEGTEGELYSLTDDPLQRVNRFGDPSLKGVREELQARLDTHESRPGVGEHDGVLVAPV
jgi:arylsulfatase A-like enzyme